MTISQILSDIELQLTQSDPSDDLQLEWRQLQFWLNYHLAELVTTECNSKIARGEMIPQLYLTKETCKIGSVEVNDCGDDCSDRIVVTLSNNVLTLNGDGGIVMIEAEDGTQVQKAGDLPKMSLFRNMRFTKPGRENLVYYRQGNKIYIEGMSIQDVPFDAFNIWCVPNVNLIDAPLTTQVVASDLVMPALIELLTQKGKLMLYGGQVDKANDGVDYKDPVYHTAIANPQNSDPAE
jgi:hypothetical protein